MARDDSPQAAWRPQAARRAAVQLGSRVASSTAVAMRGKMGSEFDT